ncbi:unnamed protein product [Peniophora sp. CBMAI 1063]|nr:unnamed protein product [Peniophora sp. CBMAI 1063]
MTDVRTQRLNLHTLPPELLNAVVDVLPERHDLLALALVCSTLRDIIVPGHIQYRVLVASEEEVGLWACLAVRGHLARNVRDLEIFDRLEFERRTQWGEPVCPRLPSWTDTDRRGLAYLEELYLAESLPRTQRSLAGRVALSRALRAMTRLESVTIHATSGMTPEDVQGKFDLISLVLGALSGTPRLVCSEWTDPSLGPDSYPATADHPLFSQAWLRTLDVRELVLNVELWPALCAMLVHSPGLEVLGVPAFRDSSQIAVATASVPSLRRLKSLYIAEKMHSPSIQAALFDFLKSANHDLRELRWTCPPLVDAPVPHVPSLRHLRNCSTPFLLRFLSGVPSCSLRLDSLGPLAFTPSHAPHLLASLSALDPTALHTLCLSAVDSPQTLQTLSRSFPAIQNLTLPCWPSCVDNTPTLSRAAYTVWNMFALSSTPSLNIQRPSAAALLTLFPHLRDVRFVDTGDETLNAVKCLDEGASVSPPEACRETVSALRKRYPGLQSVNGWKIAE